MSFSEAMAKFWSWCRTNPLSEAVARMWSWCRTHPLDALLVTGIFGVLVYFFGLYPVFTNAKESAALWSWRAWNAENDLQHGVLILPAALFIVWYHRAELAATPKHPATWSGLMVTLLGAGIYVLSVRTLQQRLAVLAFPVLSYGMVLFLWGKATARRVLFPCAFLLFMIPVGFLVSRTITLQTFTAAFAAKLASILGIAVAADGDKIFALDRSFQFQVAGGCSGIRSLTAMTMLAAVFVHFTQNTLLKKVLIFCSSLLFALIGNLVRIFSVVLFARFISPTIAGSLYHDYSGFVFFPIAVGAMVAFATLVNRDWSFLWQPDAPVATPKGAPLPLRAAGPAARTASTPAAGAKPGHPISYDY